MDDVYCFEDLSEFFREETREYQEVIEKEAKKLSFDSVVATLDLEKIAIGVGSKINHKFEKGSPISFSCNFFDDKLSNELLKVIEGYDIPF